jgi:hypothetical protein
MIGDCFSNDAYVKLNLIKKKSILYFRDPQPLSRFITGCVVSIRHRGHKVALWLSEGRDATIIREIGRRWKSMMNLSSDIHIQFDTHNESSNGPPKAALYEE